MGRVRAGSQVLVMSSDPADRDLAILVRHLTDSGRHQKAPWHHLEDLEAEADDILENWQTSDVLG